MTPRAVSRSIVAYLATASCLIAGCNSEQPTRKARAAATNDSVTTLASTDHITPASQSASSAPTKPPTHTPASSHPPTAKDTEHLTPPVGLYSYDTTTTQERENLAGGNRTTRSTSSDEVTVTADGTTRIVTTFSDGSTQETLIQRSGNAAYLTSLSFTTNSPSGKSTQRITPVPPILIARLPYVVGDHWDTAWRDESAGLQGVGTGRVRSRERTANGAELTVLELEQRIRGAAAVNLRQTVWVQSSTGVRLRDQTVIDSMGATGSHTTTERELQHKPS